MSQKWHCLCCVALQFYITGYIKQLFQQFLVKLEMLKKRSVMSIVICCRIKGQGQTAKCHFFFFSVRLCQFCMVIRFFHPCHNSQRPPTSKDFSITDFNHYIYFPILVLEKEPVIPFLMFSAKQGNYWYHFITSLV